LTVTELVWGGVCKIIGEEYFTYTNSPENDLFEKHAEGMVNKLLVNIDEVKKVELAKYASRLKSEITGKTRIFNPKGLGRMVTNNFARIIVTSNEMNAIPIDGNDRRWVIFESSAEKVGDQRYFAEFSSYMSDIGNQKAIFEFLKNRDISRVHWRKDRPTTEIYKDVQSCNTNDILAFFAFIISQTCSEKVSMRGQQLYDEYVGFMVNTVKAKGYKSSRDFPGCVQAYARESNGAIVYTNPKNKKMYVFNLGLRPHATQGTQPPIKKKGL